MRALPGVTPASGINLLPIANTGFNGPVRRLDQTGDNEGVPVTEHRTVMDGYFETMGVPIVAGRALDERDRANTPFVVVINETLARRLFPALQPKEVVGQQLRIAAGSNAVEVIGVVANVRSRRPETAPDPELYLPFAQWPNPSMSYVVRAPGDPAALAGQARAMSAYRMESCGFCSCADMESSVSIKLRRL